MESRAPNGERDAVLISWLNEYLFCPRRAALKCVEGQWEDNAYTLEGSLLHERTDTPGVEERPGVRIARALPLFSRRLGLVGKADVVEFHRQPDGSETPYPVDYKRGRRRRWENDEAQLCAQALCLEEMLGISVPSGAIFHAKSKRRRDVSFTPELRQLTESAIEHLRAMIEEKTVPLAVLHPRCDGCSLRHVCLPEVTHMPGRVAAFAQSLFNVENA